jgi:hypothetical protein
MWRRRTSTCAPVFFSGHQVGASGARPPADPSPEIELPGQIGGGPEHVERLRPERAEHEPVAADLTVGGKLGDERASRGAILGAELVDHRERGAHVPVPPQTPVHELAQHEVLDQVDPPEHRD